jgi:vancomycin resistance protein YoaR
MSMELVKIEEQQIEAVRAEIAPVLAAARAIEVTDEPSHLRALDLAMECTKRQRKVEETWCESREMAHKAWKTITETIASFTKPLAEAAKICNQKAYAWKRAEDERRQIEAQRIERENAKKVEDERLRQAEALAKAGKPALADAVLEQPIEVRPVVAEEVAKPAGVSYRENWQYTIVDEAVLPREFLMPDESKIGKVVKAMKAATKIPGIKVWDAGTMVVRR